ncbi:hypothetical protein HYX16_05665 [Candidatus Woesearchaeota archaeon]|nr:hypothetical protein [Candidatus Woesearchaeota archaeon]
MYEIFETVIFKENIYDWPLSHKTIIPKIIDRLKQNPFLGSPLGYKFFREIRIKEKRIYFLVYEDLNLVLLVSASGKKNQQEMINNIKSNLNKFKEMVKKLKQPFLSAFFLHLPRRL